MELFQKFGSFDIYPEFLCFGSITAMCINIGNIKSIGRMSLVYTTFIKQNGVLVHIIDPVACQVMDRTGFVYERFGGFVLFLVHIYIFG